MLRSMYSAVSGLRNHQIMLDVVGNNIANVNTFGFKAGRAVFEDNLSQLVRGAAAPTAAAANGQGIGGINPAQIGLGVRLGGITNIMNQGGLQVTNQTTDLAIQGDGFFTVQKAGQEFYTRNGAFSFDTDGNLVTSNGSYVLGAQYTPGSFNAADGTLSGNGIVTTTDGAGQTFGMYGPIRLPSANSNWDAALAGSGTPPVPVSLQSFQINPDGKIIGAFSDGSKRVFAQVAVTTFNNPQGLEKIGGSLYTATTNSGVPEVGLPAFGGRGTVESGTLEMSNVDLAQEFTNLIVSQRGFQANSRVVTASDEVLQDLVNMKR